MWFGAKSMYDAAGFERGGPPKAEPADCSNPRSLRQPGIRFIIPFRRAKGRHQRNTGMDKAPQVKLHSTSHYFSMA